MENTITTIQPKISDYLNEELEVILTRREVYWLRKVVSKRLQAATQRMTAPLASPAKRSAGREEYEFMSCLTNHLYGVESDPEEYAALEEAEKVRQALDLKARADSLTRQAELVKQQIRDMNLLEDIV